jgi:hypothetical protein
MLLGETDSESAYESEESRDKDRAWKYVLGIIITLSVAALPHSRFQVLLKMGVWTALFLGLVLTYTWPFLVDGVARLTVTCISIAHFFVVFFLPSVAPSHGYLLIGAVTGVEFLLSLLPIAWLDVRSQKLRAGKQ